MVVKGAVGTTLFTAFICSSVLLLRLHGAPQQADQRRRITGNVNTSRTVRLRNTTHLLVRRAGDKGRVPRNLQMDRVILTLQSSPEQEADLKKLLAEQQNPSSPHYHEWVTPRQFGERFGASTADVEVIRSWLQSRGMRITEISNSRREIEFSGTAKQIEDAFLTEIHNYEIDGEMHIANATDISFPEALSPVVSGVVSLHDFAPKPQSHRLQPIADLNLSGRHALAPYDFATIYDVLPLWNEGFDGTGQSIAIVGRSNLKLSDVAAFRTQYGLPANDPKIIVNGIDPGVVSQNEEVEADLDVQWSGAVAKGATIKLVVSRSTRSTDGTVLSAMYIVNNNVAPVLSSSFGFCEGMYFSSSQFYANLWRQASAEGISVIVASGDSGSAGCDFGSVARQGLSVDGEASTPYNVAVGGTQLDESGQDSVYWSATNNPQNRSSAKIYIPEIAWNGSGGGVSIVHSTPTWQTGYGVPTVDPGTTDQHHRYVPDLSLSAAGHDGYMVTQTVTFNPDTFTISGTSAAAPAFAGIMAIVNQITNQANGNPNPRLYTLAAQVPSAFHDITSGTNAPPCLAGSPDCINGMLTGYAAGPGYDLVTGWGSIDAYVFVHSWADLFAVPVGIRSSPALTSASIGTAYMLNLTASGGLPPYTWSVAAGSLPSGFSLSPSGVLSGTPTAPGSYSFTVQLTDNSGRSVSQGFQIAIMSVSPTASTYHVFPQFADGRRSDGTYYRSTVMISNPSSSNAACKVQLRGLTVPGFALDYTVRPSGWVIASTNAAQAFQSGYATLLCDTKVEAQLLYSYYSPDGTKLSEATVFSSPPNSTVQVLADQREGARLGLAIANDSDQSSTYTLNAGGASTTTTITLPPRTSLAKFLDELVPEISPDNVGIVQVTASGGSASVVGLRFTGSIFTTIPQTTDPPVSATAATYHVFPQFADGKFSNGSYYRTTRLYINASSTSAADCTTQGRGVIIDGSPTTVFPGNFIISDSTGTDAIQSGYATTLCSSPVDAQELYSFYAADGTKLSEATVFSSPSARTVQILADGREGAQVGLAIANDSDQPTSCTIVVTDTSGNVLGSSVQSLNARSSLSKFLTDFVNLPANYVGQVTVSANTGTVSIIGLRYTGSVFTTIPETIRPQ